jgi:hypothetical protein|tara:strand:- start:4843 stop:5013 length:171 start_codon:yes stop_codon:yes gene_type:complete
MKKTEYVLVLEKEIGNIHLDSFPSKLLAEEERDNRNRLCIAMGYSPDVKYIIKKIN